MIGARPFRFRSRRQENVVAYGIILLVLLAVYFPVYSSYYVVHDDYSYFFPLSRWGSLAMHGGSYTYLSIGRPIAAIIQTAFSLVINSVQDMNIARFVTVVTLSALAFLVYLWMRKNSVRTVHALLLVISISVLATFQVQVAWLTTYIVTFGAFAAVISALLAHKAVLTGWVRPKMRRGLTYQEWLLAYRATPKLSVRKMILSKWTVLSIAALFVSLATYQTAAMFYWVSVAIVLGNTRPQSWRRRLKPIIYFCLVPLTVTMLYLVIFSLFSLFVQQPESLASSPYHWMITTKVTQKMSWFLKYPLRDAMNLWDIFPSTLFVFSFIFIAAGGLLCEILSSWRNAHNASERRSLLFSCLQKSGFLLLLFPLSMLPNLVAEGTLSSYRSLVALSPLIVVVLYWGLSQIIQFSLPKRKKMAISLCLLIAALIGVFTARHNVTDYYVYPHSAELKYVKSILQEADLGKYKKVHVLRPKNPYGRYDEFGMLTTSYPQDVYRVIKVALTELNRERLFDTLQVSSSTRAGAGDLDGQTLLIDMTVLEKQLGY